MNKLNRSIFITILFSQLSYQGGAQTFTLEDCISIAIEKNVPLQVSKNDQRIQISNWRQSKLTVIPEVSLSFNYNYIFGTVFDNVTYQRVQRTTVNSFPALNLNTCLFEGFAKIYRNKYYENLSNKSSVDVRIKQQEVILNVVKSYSDILSLQNQKELQLKRVEELTQLYSNLLVMKDKGEKSEADLAQVKAQLEKEKISLLRAENLRYTSLVEFCYYVNDSTLMDKSPAPLQLGISDFDTLFSIEAEWMPMYRSQFYATAAITYQNKLAWSDFSPKLYLNSSLASSYSSNGIFDYATGQISYPSYSQQLKLNSYQFVGLSLQIPLFSGLSKFSQVQRSKLELSSQKLIDELTLNNAKLEISKLKADIKTTIRTIEMLREQLRSTELAYKFTLKNFEMGESSFYELLSSMNSMNQSQLDLKNSEYELCLLAKKKEILKSVL